MSAILWTLMGICWGVIGMDRKDYYAKYDLDRKNRDRRSYMAYYRAVQKRAPLSPVRFVL
jgi:hypothetical protein